MVNGTVSHAVQESAMRKRARQWLWPRSPAFWFLFPAVFALAVIGIYPLLVALFNSVHQYRLADLESGTPFVGLDNYVATLTDATFW